MVPDESKIEALLALSQGCFKRRTQIEVIEWKVNFATWTAIAVSAWALHGLPRAEHIEAWACLYCLAPLLHLAAVSRFTAHSVRMRDLGGGYAAQVEALIESKTPESSVKPPSQAWWFFIELLPTVILTGAAVMLAW